MDMMDSSGGHADEGEGRKGGREGEEGDAQVETLRTAGLLGGKAGGWVDG